MCLAVPMKVIKLKDNVATCEYEGMIRTARVDFLKNVKVGDYVLIHAGFAIEKLNIKDAQETLRIFRELNENN